MFYIQYKHNANTSWLPLTCNSSEGQATADADRFKQTYPYVRVVDASGHLVYQA